VAHVLPFFNQGGEAGATLSHPHGQILAAPLVPDLVATEMACQAAFRRQGGDCLLCDVLAREEAAGERIVAAGAGAVVLAPWASRFPCELLAAPRRHATGPVAAPADDCAAVAAVLGPALRALAAVRPAPPLNMVLHAGPVGAADESFHWHLEVLPRWTRLAGFEAGSGFAINSTAPESAARRLREEVARCAS
jgi:UDPglucose--hexose-1-phosphate uridylyltransferase